MNIPFLQRDCVLPTLHTCGKSARLELDFAHLPLFMIFCLAESGVFTVARGDVQVGAAKLQDGLSINYAGIEGFRVAGDQGVLVIAACQV